MQARSSTKFFVLHHLSNKGLHVGVAIGAHKVRLDGRKGVVSHGWNDAVYVNSWEPHLQETEAKS